jgi:hypothetical protein
VTPHDFACSLSDVRTRREQQIGSGLEEVQIGLSCSSATMRLSDETVSLHGAAMAARLRRAFSASKREADGYLYTTVFDSDRTLRAIEHRVQPVAIVTARNDKRWQVRFAHGLIEQMQVALRRARPNETGGLMIGMVHAGRRIIYVTRLLDAPQDSSASPAEFTRGG